MEEDKAPCISVVMPVYNCNKYLPRAIESVLNQSFEDFELILIDDGSTDGSGAICDTYAVSDGRIRIVHKENGGVSSARNAGLDVAQGTYIVFLDCDDYIEEDYLEKFLQPDSDLFIASYVLEDENATILLRKDLPVINFNLQVDNAQTEACFINGFFNYAWAKRFKRGVIEKYRIRFSEDLTIGEDTLFVMDYLQHAGIISIENYHGYHYVKYKRTTLTNQKLSTTMIAELEKANHLLCDSLGVLFGNEATRITSRRIAILYRNILTELAASETIDSGLIRFLFRQYWFRKSIGEEIMLSGENWKYRMVVKARSGGLFLLYINVYRRFSIKHKG